VAVRNFVCLFFFLAAPPICAADPDLDAAIGNRMGALTIHADPGAKITVEQVRHEFWFGAALPGGVFNGRARPEDAKWKEIFFSHFNAGVPEADFKMGHQGAAEGAGELRHGG
jgi:hypothetical protein